MSKIGFMIDVPTYQVVDIGDVTISTKYSTVFSLNMHKAIDCNGLVSWVDMGADFDLLRTNFKIELALAKARVFEKYLKTRDSDPTVTIKNFFIYDADGFYPLTTLYKSNLVSVSEYMTDGNNEYQLSILNVPKPSKVNMFSDYVQYSLETAPISGLLVASDAFPVCIAYSGWTFSGVDLPYSDNQFDKAELNINSAATQLNEGTDNSFYRGRTYGDITKVNVVIDEAKTKELLTEIQSERGSQVTCTFPSEYNPFAHIYIGITSFSCILYNSDIKVSPKDHHNFEVEFMLQVVGTL